MGIEVVGRHTTEYYVDGGRVWKVRARKKVRRGQKLLGSDRLSSGREREGITRQAETLLILFVTPRVRRSGQNLQSEVEEERGGGRYKMHNTMGTKKDQGMEEKKLHTH